MPAILWTAMSSDVFIVAGSTSSSQFHSQEQPENPFKLKIYWNKWLKQSNFTAPSLIITLNVSKK